MRYFVIGEKVSYALVSQMDKATLESWGRGRTAVPWGMISPAILLDEAESSRL